MIDYHEDFITKYTEKLLVEAMKAREIQKIDPRHLQFYLGALEENLQRIKIDHQ